jgi:hypothetical protein
LRPSFAGLARSARRVTICAWTNRQSHQTSLAACVTTGRCSVQPC